MTKVEAVFEVLRRKADETGYGSWITDESLLITAEEIVKRLEQEDVK